MSTAAPNTELAASSAPAATAVRRTRPGPPSSSGISGCRGPRGRTGRSSGVRGPALPPEQRAHRDGQPIFVHSGFDRPHPFGADGVDGDRVNRHSGDARGDVEAVEHLGHRGHRALICGRLPPVTISATRQSFRRVNQLATVYRMPE